MPATGRRRSEARERLLATASMLFYAEGINNVGVERIIKEGNVSLATFYRHFPSKQNLVVAYLQGVHGVIAERAEAAAERVQGRELVRALGAQVVSELGRPGFRGCAFINAASDVEDPDGPVREVIAAHRRWYFKLLQRAFAEAGHQRPGNVARHFVMLRDGAMSAAYLDTASTAARTFKRGVEGLVSSIDIDPLTDDADEA